MKLSAKAALAVVVATYTPTVMADTTSYCPKNQKDVCFQWGVPEASANSGSGNVYFQLSAPTSVEWVGLGIGSRMAGAQMFVMYQNGDNNVTLSTRDGKNHVMPTYSERDDVELLEGSGVVDGKMIANVRCGKCTDLDLKSNSNWLSAWKNGSPLNSNDPSERITFHDDFETYTVDFSKASISSDSNPFASSGNGGDKSGGGGSNTGSGGSSAGGAVQSKGDPNRTLIYAHGILMAIVFIGGFPIGSMLMPLVGNWMIHAGWQFLSFLGMWAGFGIGYVIAHRKGIFFDQHHTRLGVFVVSLMGIQPILGWLHHQQYLKQQKRGIFSHIHVWYGRALMILGIVNGGLGLWLANGSKRFIIAYSVLAGVVFLLYLASIALGLTRRRSASKNLDTSSKE